MYSGRLYEDLEKALCFFGYDASKGESPLWLLDILKIVAESEKVNVGSLAQTLIEKGFIGKSERYICRDIVKMLLARGILIKGREKYTYIHAVDRGELRRMLTDLERLFRNRVIVLEGYHERKGNCAKGDSYKINALGL